jgi:glutamate-ammonia-ligase adenylyltransferase
VSGPVESLIAGLERGEVADAALEALGSPDVATAGPRLLAAVANADLAPSRARWLPELLLSARPGYAAQCLEELAHRYRETRGRALDLGKHPALPRLLGSSDFLARLLLRHPHWSEELAGDPPDAPDESAIEPEWTAIRIAKYKGLLRIAARDVVGRPFEQSLGELSRLADRCLAAALAAAARETATAPPALFALGKLGGAELNFSSDVDLLFLYESSNDAPDLERHAAVARLVQTLKKHLEVPSEDGFGYRVDLELRPEGRAGVIVNPVDAALGYYETFGADWERQMLIRLRHVAGPSEPAQAFERGIRPFVWRRSVGPEAIRGVRAMKQRIEDERLEAGRDLEADLKEGPGGIRDVEFLVQAFQLFFGGRQASLRTGNVIEGLEALCRLGLLARPVTDALRDAYLWLRRAEHCVQMVDERQTQAFPRDARAQLGLARRMGYVEPEGRQARAVLLDDWTRVRAEVRAHFENLVLESPESDEP